MRKYFVVFGTFFLILWGVGCSESITPTTTAVPPTAVSPTPTISENLPEIIAVSLDLAELPQYESLEMTVDIEAEYKNPYELRDVRLDGIFNAPHGTERAMSGFWDGEEAWRVRFTPSQEGKWQYRLFIEDTNGQSLPFEGSFNVISSNLHGWLQPGNVVNDDYSGHYLVHHDGTPFYGLGHADALNILIIPTSFVVLVMMTLKRRYRVLALLWFGWGLWFSMNTKINYYENAPPVNQGTFRYTMSLFPVFIFFGDQLARANKRLQQTIVIVLMICLMIASALSAIQIWLA